MREKQTVDLVGHENAGDIGAVNAHLRVPLAQVLVCDLPGRIEH